MEAAVSSKRGGRRKACDLCCQKKIRCNGAKPQCSQCQTYDSECVYNGARRNTNPRISAIPIVKSLEARMGRMEAMLEGLMAQIQPLTQSEDIRPAMEDVQQISLLAGEREGGWALPPLANVLPIVEEYFSSTNRLFPLFNQTAFMQMLCSWYSTPIQRDPVVWASINVVLALGLLLNPLVASGGNFTIATLIKNAQSVLDEIVSREEDLLGAQVVLGLCLLFQESPDPQPASVLAATAVTLVHRLRLYSRARQANLNLTDVKERNRLFWIAYIMDKNISLRAQQPPLLADAWADIDLPEADPIDGAGVICNLQGTSKMNFLRLRVELGIIQGKAYDWLYSVAADKLLPAVKEEYVLSIERALCQWEESLPREFMADAVLEHAPPGTIQHLAALHWTYLHTFALIHRVHSHNQQWIQSFLRCSTIVLDEPIACAIAGPQPSLPASWSKLVGASRACMKLLDNLSADEELLPWSTLCGRITGIFLLLMNNLTEPQHEMVREDQRLIERAIHLLGPTAAKSKNKQFQQIYKACQELGLKTRILMERNANAITASGVEYYVSDQFLELSRRNRD